MEDLEKKTAEKPEETEAALPEQDAQPSEPYTPRPLGVRIFAAALAIIVIVGLILYYYNIFTAGR